MSARPRAAVVIAGAGVIGSATAYNLARLGVEVTLLDRSRTPAGATASGASAGGVRAQGRTLPELPLAVDALDRWLGLEDELGEDLDYRREGMTVCVDRPDLVAPLARRIERERAAGVDVRLVEGGALHRLVPGLAPGVVAGSYAPQDGHANPLRTTKAFARAAQRLGARVRPDTALVGVRLAHGRVVGAETTDGEIACDSVLLAAGAWTVELGRRLGLDLPLRAGCIQMLVTEAMPHRLDQVLAWVGEGISLKQQPSGGYLIGGGWPGVGDVQSYRADVRPESVGRSADVAVRLFPALAGASALRAWVGFESWGPHDAPLIGPLAAVPGLWLAAGFSGHGFALSPAVGAALADWLATRTPPALLAPFDPGRPMETGWQAGPRQDTEGGVRSAG